MFDATIISFVFHLEFMEEMLTIGLLIIACWKCSIDDAFDHFERFPSLNVWHAKFWGAFFLFLLLLSSAKSQFFPWNLLTQLTQTVIPETVGCFISSSWQTYRFVYQFLNFLALQGQQNWEELTRAPKIANSDIKFDISKKTLTWIRHNSVFCEK